MQRTVTSSDGTKIAFEQTGAGPSVILVNAALSDRTGSAKVAKHLAARFTVINYDRRGRGKSTDTQPYACAREVEDVDALIEAAGGHAHLFGNSSGAVLALDAAQAFGSRIDRVFIYEPPFIIDDTHAPVLVELSQEMASLIANGDRNGAVRLFFMKAMGLPGFAVTLMRWLMPGWKIMAACAPTLPYDLQLLAGTQSGQPLPQHRWNAITAPILVMVGGKSEPFFHNGAKSLAAIVSGAQYRALPGRDHSAILMAAKDLADAAAEFYRG